MSIVHINPSELEKMLADNPSLQLVDVRTPEEFYALGHIPQAKLIPLYELPYAFRTLDPQYPVVVTCQHGMRSIDACYFLQAQGFEQVFNLQEGMSTWAGPLERDLTLYEQLLNSQDQGD